MKNLVCFFALFILPFVGTSQTGNIQGTISDENGIYLPGVNVMISILARGKISNFNGRFTLIGIPGGANTLSEWYLG
ncbi:MAG: carboxypeptidase-like regulatory domain-containing protein [Maribacter sp.]